MPLHRWAQVCVCVCVFGGGGYLHLQGGCGGGHPYNTHEQVTTLSVWLCLLWAVFCLMGGKARTETPVLQRDHP
jgi:hypothetical protein